MAAIFGRPSSGRTGRWAVLATSVVVSAALVVGCSGAGDGSDNASSADAGGGEAAEVAAADSGAGSGADVAALGAPDVGDRIAYEAAMRVRAEDPAAASRAALDLVETAGGALVDQHEVTGGEVSLTVRVPVERFRAILDEVADLGVELERTVNAEDVTDRIVDLDARLKNARASADRLRTLFADAADVNQVVAVEGALTQREAEVESLAAQVQTLSDRADRSTVSVSFVEEGEPPVEEDDASWFVRGLRSGRDVLEGAGSGVAAAAGFLVPLLPVLAVVGAAAWAVRRRRRRVGAAA